MKTVPVVFSFIVAVFVFFACDANMFYDQSQTIPENGWDKDSTAYFTVDVEDTTRLYDFYITLRNNDDYAFRNFYLFLTTHLPNQNITRDTLELILADKEGKWLGSGFGAVKDNQIQVRKNLKFPLKGKYRFGIIQAMRREKLKGITDIGIRIEYAND